MQLVRPTLAIGLVLIAVALALVLSGSPMSVTAANGVKIRNAAGVGGSMTLCQSGETLPAGTSAIRESLSANVGPRVTLRVLSGTRVLAEGTHPAGWGVDETVTVGVKPLSVSMRHVRICALLGPSSEGLELRGTAPEGAHHKARGARSMRMRVEYLHAGPHTWLSLAASVARHMGFGHSPGGLTAALLALMIAIALFGWTARLITWELR